MVATGALLHPARVIRNWWHPRRDNRTVLSGRRTKRAKLWDVATGKLVCTWTIRSVLDLERTCDARRRRVDITRMMLWTAPTLRHRSAIGWLRRNEPL